MFNEEDLGQLWQLYVAWQKLAREAHQLSDSADDPTVAGYYHGVAETWEAAANDILQWLETLEGAEGGQG
jgi:hypothetical protein